MKEAMKDEVLVHPDLGTNRSALWTLDSGGRHRRRRRRGHRRGPPDGVVIEREFRQQRLIPAFMEPRSVVVDPTGEQISMWSATQIPHILRFLLAATTGVAESKIRSSPPTWVAASVASSRRRPRSSSPSRWRGSSASRSSTRDPVRVAPLGSPRTGPVAEADPVGEEGRHRHRIKVELARRPRRLRRARRRRRPGPRRVDVQLDLQVPAYRFTVQTVLTNKTWVDAYRGGGPEATFGVERMMDELANELGVDPLELREKNWIKHEFPFTTVAGMTYDSGNYEAATARARALRLRRAAGRAAAPREQRPGPARHRVSTFTEMCGLAPSRVLGRSATAPAAGSTRRSACCPPARSRS